MSQRDIQKIIDLHPNLTDFGIGIFRNPTKSPTPEERQTEFQKQQSSLLNSVESFKKTCNWLSTKQKIKSLNRKHTSYGLKHMAEKEIGYITQID